jgi:hypothetical protein
MSAPGPPPLGPPVTYDVEDGDTLFTVVVSRGLDYDVVLKMNPSLG